MFVSQEEDHFPGEFHNFYIIELTSSVSGLPKNVGDEFEVKGHDFDSFIVTIDGAEHIIEKSKTRILKKMIKPVK